MGINNLLLLPNQRIRKALQQIFGIGPHLADQIADQLGMSENFRVMHCTKLQINQLSQLIHKSYFTEFELKQLVLKDKERFKLIGCYKGFRQIAKLPVRGQRTKTNAKTCRNSKVK